MQIIPEAKKLNCGHARSIIVQLDNDTFELDQVTARLRKIEARPQRSFNQRFEELPKLSSHSFHQLVLINITDINQHTYMSNLIKVSEISYQITSKDQKIVTKFSKPWETARDEISQQIFGDWTKEWRIFITIIACISLLDCVIRVALVIIESYAGNGRLGRILFGTLTQNTSTVRKLKAIEKPRQSELELQEITPKIERSKLNNSIRYTPIAKPTSSRESSVMLLTVNDQYKRLPIINAKINSLPIKCLIDTGASITVAPIELANTLGCTLTRSSSEAISASGHAIQVNYQSEVLITIAQKTIEIIVNFISSQTFSNKTFDIILGCDTLEHWPSVSINLKNREVYFGRTPIKMSDHPNNTYFRISSANSISLTPNSQTIITGTLENEISTNSTYIITHLEEKMREKNIGMVPLVNNSQNGSIKIVLTNPTQNIINIHKNQHIALSSLLTLDSANPNILIETEQINNITQDNPKIVEDPKFKIDFTQAQVDQEDLNKLKELCEEFHDIFSKSQYDLGSYSDGQYDIITETEKPVASKPRRTPFRYKEELEKHIDQLVKAGVMVESDTPWLTPFVVVQKKDGSIRPCLDFRKLNEITVPDHYPLPRLEVIMEKVGNCNFYSSLDLASGYLQIKLTDNASRKCGVITEDKIYQMTHMPFGLKNATSVFCRAMTNVLSGLEDSVISYVDDILIFTKSPDFSEHIDVLRKVFERFRHFNLKLKPQKCIFGSNKMHFLGHILDANGYKPSLSRIEIIKNLAPPENVKGIKRIVGMASFYRRHIHDFSTIVEPLTRLTKKDTPFVWGSEQQSALDKIKELLAQEPSLIFPDYSKPFHIFTDASTVGQAGVLMQKNENTGTYSAISYCSRTLAQSERKWPPVQIELGAIIFALREFKPYIFMSDVELHTDHKPLAYLLKKAEAHPHLARWLIELQSYQIKIVHIAGKQNSLADALSRIHEEAPEKIENLKELEDIAEFPVCLAIKPSSRLTTDEIINSVILRDDKGQSFTVEIKTEQREDPEAKAYIDFLENGSTPEGFTEAEIASFVNRASTLCLDSDILYYKPSGLKMRLYIPVSLRSLIFESFHNSPLGGGHLSVKKTIRKCQKYFWPMMYTDISEWTKQCITCQLRQSPTPAYRAEMTMAPSNTLFAKVGLDLAGPFPMTEKGNKYILNIICWFTKYIISVPVPDTKSQTIAKAFLNECYLKFGGCTELISDNATTFTSEFFKDFCHMLYINKKYAIPNWSQGNAITERTFRTFNNILSKYITKNQPNFDEFLNFTNFCYNTAVHNTTNETPFYLMFGRDPIFCVDQILDPKIRDPIAFNDTAEFKQLLVTSLRVAWESAAETHKEAQIKMKEQYDKHIRVSTIQIGDRVLIRNYAGKPGTSKKFHLPWKGIYRVLNIEGIYVQ
uniref:RNA-directed DNA polymerase n=1 Tax=Meloidogyne enterolobii TaxID=390850 RepID=A0A6V7W0J6_MELEN|nr:unnamed protein product [Meloidogyne enterolobii]